MSGFNLTRAKRQRRSRPTIHLKCIDKKSCSDNVHDRIDGAHFVERDIRNRDPMDTCFSPGQEAENPERMLLGRR